MLLRRSGTRLLGKKTEITAQGMSQKNRTNPIAGHIGREKKGKWTG